MPNDPSSLSLNDLMRRLGGAPSGSPERTPLEVEFERRKFVWLRAAVVVAGAAVVVGCAGVLTLALRPPAPVVATAPQVLPRVAVSAPNATPAAAVPAFTRELLQKEPEIGMLPTGAAALVDDGTCPPGQIKQVVGGSISAGVPRTRSCIARP